MASRARQTLPAIAFTISPEEVLQYVELELEREPRVEIAERAEGYLAATVRSRLLGFVDDVEFQVDPIARLLHFRSASRTGYYDFGVNRRRMRRLADRILARLRER